MKPISDSLPSTASAATSAGATKRTEIDRRVGDALWLVLAELFGSRLVAQFGEECPKAWHRTLADLSHDDIKRGLYWLREEGREWPPTAPEFHRLCRKSMPPQPPRFKALPEPRYPAAEGRKRVQELRDILAGKNVPENPWEALR